MLFVPNRTLEIVLHTFELEEKTYTLTCSSYGPAAAEHEREVALHSRELFDAVGLVPMLRREVPFGSETLFDPSVVRSYATLSSRLEIFADVISVVDGERELWEGRDFLVLSADSRKTFTSANRLIFYFRSNLTGRSLTVRMRVVERTILGIEPMLPLPWLQSRVYRLDPEFLAQQVAPAPVRNKIFVRRGS